MSFAPRVNAHGWALVLLWVVPLLWSSNYVIARAANGPGYSGKARKYDVQWNTDTADPDGWRGLEGHTDITGNDGTVQATTPIDGTRKFYRLNLRIE